jgi:hypothetical protein
MSAQHDMPRLLLPPALEPTWTQVPMPSPLTSSERALAERLIAAEARAARFEEALHWISLLNHRTNLLSSQVDRDAVADHIDGLIA